MVYETVDAKSPFPRYCDHIPYTFQQKSYYFLRTPLFAKQVANQGIITLEHWILEQVEEEATSIRAICPTQPCEGLAYEFQLCRSMPFCTASRRGCGLLRVILQILREKTCHLIVIKNIADQSHILYSGAVVSQALMPVISILKRQNEKLFF